jgi:hypothetical protein
MLLSTNGCDGDGRAEIVAESRFLFAKVMIK